MVLTAYVVLSSVTGLFCTVVSGYVLPKPGWADLNSANLTPASGRQDHTILPYATTSLVRVLLIAHRPKPALQSRRTQNAAASTASAPRVRDDRDTPLWWGGMARTCRDDLPDGWSEIFLQTGLDTKMPDGQIRSRSHNKS